MRSIHNAMVARDLPEDLARVAKWWVRLSVQFRRIAGQDEDTIRREILARFRAQIEAESFGLYADETLMAAVRKGLDAALGEAPS